MEYNWSSHPKQWRVCILFFAWPTQNNARIGPSVIKIIIKLRCHNNMVGISTNAEEHTTGKSFTYLTVSWRNFCICSRINNLVSILPVQNILLTPIYLNLIWSAYKNHTVYKNDLHAHITFFIRAPEYSKNHHQICVQIHNDNCLNSLNLPFNYYFKRGFKLRSQAKVLQYYQLSSEYFIERRCQS